MGSFMRGFAVLVYLYSAVVWAQYPITVTDASGKSLTLDKAPQKISSKSLFSDEVLLDMIPTQRFSSVTNLVDDEHFSVIAGKVPASVPRLGLNVEQILANRPDLVFAATWSDAGRIHQLRSAGINVFILPVPSTLAEIEDLIKLIGKIVGEDNKAKTIVVDMERKLEEGLVYTSHKYKVLDYNNWGTSSTRHSTWQLIVNQAGFENVVADLDADKFGQTPMSKELIVALDPEVLFVPSVVKTDKAGSTDLMHQVLTDPALRNVQAVKLGNVYPIPQYLRGTYSQHIVDTILFVNRAVLGTPAP
ncbi:putative ABC transporter substrate-binding protein [Vibrio halioticoli NBRC 102217]|uniref:Putative ABC transporter substrate-binding protein n=1 Tax=Vibrio halioticoli NBRC 102217 TaxID=1219072 RepID=V5FI96_9VIBR|nr:ABC transporter substrate-binding protein [Vibrio halioticoli]GAD88727.1 putative ABC transporter substrate-binding protein [Vibrio halioticoli NBRC 102217]